MSTRKVAKTKTVIPEGASVVVFGGTKVRRPPFSLLLALISF